MRGLRHWVRVEHLKPGDIIDTSSIGRSSVHMPTDKWPREVIVVGTKARSLIDVNIFLLGEKTLTRLRTSIVEVVNIDREGREQ